MQQIKQAAIKALVYSDLFDYPLTAKELWEYAVSQKPFSLDQLQKALGTLKKVSEKNNFYVLLGREKLISLRVEREKIGNKKIKKAQKISQMLSYIPTIRFIGVSGSVAMRNASAQDDIDLFFITKKNSVWVSRFLVTILLQLGGVRRRWNASDVTDTICANMFLDEEVALSPMKKQNLYIAHEIVQIKPLFSVGKIYDNFLDANTWTTDLLPNWRRASSLEAKTSPVRDMIGSAFLPLEPICRWIQTTYMKRKRTTETITKSLIAFHPNDASERILREFERKYQTYAV